jgi:hypothetical protein
MDSREPRFVCSFAKSSWFNFRHPITVFVRNLAHTVTLIARICGIITAPNSHRPGATLALSQYHFRKRISMPQSPQQNLDNFSPKGVSGIETRQPPLLPSPDSGMIVLSSSARILHMNGPARALMSLFGVSHEHWPQMAPESMPSIITEFCLDVLAQLRRRVEAQDWTQFEMRRTCHMITPSLLLTGFGVPSASNSEIRIIMTLTPLFSTPYSAANARPSPPPTDVHTPSSTVTS